MNIRVALIAAALAACSRDVPRQFHRAPCSFDANTTCELGCDTNLDMTGPSCMARDEFGAFEFCATTFTSPDFGPGCCLFQATSTETVAYFFDCE